MYTKTADNPLSQNVTLQEGNWRDDAVLIGASQRGWIYRSTRGLAWYRLVPIQDAPLDWRHSLRSEHPPKDAPVLVSERDWQQPIQGAIHLVMLYRSELPAQSLAECLGGFKPSARLKSTISCLRGLRQWWKAAAAPLLPMPADMIVDEQGQARLLWAPRGALPNASSIFADRQRALYVSPEFLRAASNVPWDTMTWEAVDRYAIGVSLLNCYFELPGFPNADTALSRAANGTLFSRLTLRADLPVWLARFEQHRNTLSLARRLTSSQLNTRAQVDLEVLADRLEHELELFDPRAAAARLRDRTQPLEALNLLRELFPQADSADIIDADQRYDLLLLAAELCARYLRSPLEAIDYYERALALRPERREAYREQLRVIANARHHPALASLLESDSEVAVQADIKLWRNHRLLTGPRASHAIDDDDKMDDLLVARYVLWRKQFDVARDFIYPRLLDEQQNYIWWDFDLNLAYVSAFIGLEKGDHSNLALAAKQLQQIKGGLQHIEQSGALEPELVHQYGEEVAALEFQIVQARAAVRD